MEITLYAVALVGVACGIIGWRGRRIDDLPYCRRCRYCLAGPARPASCPECGRDVTRRRAVRIGARRRRVVLIAFGLLLLGSGAGGAVTWSKRFADQDPMALKPEWWLTLEAEYGSVSTATAALRELDARLLAGTLSPDTLADLCAHGLARQADPDVPWIPEWGNLIEAAWHADLVDDSTLDRYFDQAIAPTFAVRERCQSSATLRAELTLPPPRCAVSSMFTINLWIPALKLEGLSMDARSTDYRSTVFNSTFCSTPLVVHFEGSVAVEPTPTATAELVGAVALTSCLQTANEIQPDPRDQSERTADADRALRDLQSTPLSQLRVTQGPRSHSRGSRPRVGARQPRVVTRLIERTALVEIVDTTVPVVATSVDPAQRDTITQAFSIAPIEMTRFGVTHISFRSMIHGNCSIPHAFRAVLTLGDATIDLGPCVMDRDRHRIAGSMTVDGEIPTGPTEVTVTLVPDPAATGVPFDVTSIWGEPIDLGTHEITIPEYVPPHARRRHGAPPTPDPDASAQTTAQLVDATFGAPPDPAAIRELAARIRAGRLDDVGSVVEPCVARITEDPSNAATFGILVEAAFIIDQLPDAQLQQYARVVFAPEFSLRAYPRACAGETLELTVDPAVRHAHAEVEGMTVQYEIDAVRIGETDVDIHRGDFLRTSVPTPLPKLNPRVTRRLAARPPAPRALVSVPDALGTAPVIVTGRVVMVQTALPQNHVAGVTTRAESPHAVPFTARGVVDIVATPDAVVVREPCDAERWRDQVALNPAQFVINNTGTQHAVIWCRTEPLPVTLAIVAEFIIERQTFTSEPIVIPAGERGIHAWSVPLPPELTLPPTLDIVLRTDAAAATAYPDITSVAEFELTFYDHEMTFMRH